MSNVLAFEAPLKCKNELIVRFATRFFLESPRELGLISNSQAAKVLRHIVSPTGSGYLAAAMDDSVAFSTRKRLVESIVFLFKNYFAPNCANILTHKRTEYIDDLNSICYMWWDVIPVYPRRTKVAMQFEASILQAMQEILLIDHLACQESAIHGLGHWQPEYPDEVSHVLGQFMKGLPETEPIREYAQQASEGCIP